MGGERGRHSDFIRPSDRAIAVVWLSVAVLNKPPGLRASSNFYQEWKEQLLKIQRVQPVVTDSLASYLYDHHAGAKFAMELLERLHNRHSGKELGAFAGELLIRVREDCSTLEHIIVTVGGGQPMARSAAAWISEKVTEPRFGNGSLGVFESLEAIALGALGKAKLWEALSKVSLFDERLREFDFAGLISRAKLQHDQVEQHRLAALDDAFGRASKQ